MITFDDYLGLREKDFSRHRLVVFAGRSGSGKSTAIRFLLDEHPDFRDRECEWLEGPSFKRRPGDAALDVVVLDDLISLGDLRFVRELLPRARTLLVASHVPVQWFHVLMPLVRTSGFHTDRDRGKVARALADRGVTATDAAVGRFVAIFGATYTDLDIVLERYPGPSFDISLARFLKFCKTKTEG